MKKRVLILCTGNSARSQMAEGLLRHDAGDRFEVESAGTRPGHVRSEAIAEEPLLQSTDPPVRKFEG
jgi:arsenate reductase